MAVSSELYGTIYRYFEEGFRKKCARDNPEGDMGYDLYAVPDTVAVELTSVAFLQQSQT